MRRAAQAPLVETRSFVPTASRFVYSAGMAWRMIDAMFIARRLVGWRVFCLYLYEHALKRVPNAAVSAGEMNR